MKQIVLLNTNYKILSVFQKLQLTAFELLSDNEIDLLKAHSSVVKYNKGEVIFVQNGLVSQINFIYSGLVKTYKETKSGKVLVLNIVQKSNFIGLMSVFSNIQNIYSASAIEQCEVLQIDKTVFREIVKANAPFADQLLNSISNQGNLLIDKLMGLYQKQLPGRIADVILFFSEQIYQSNTFSFPLSRRELAELAGTTKESFIRTLTEFKNDKIIYLDGKLVEIKSLEILKILSEVG